MYADDSNAGFGFGFRFGFGFGLGAMYIGDINAG